MNRDVAKFSLENAIAAELFNQFTAASSMKQILALHRKICETLKLKPNRLPEFYPKLKEKLVKSWKAQAVLKKFDIRANHKVYAKGQACPNTRVLIIGAGPCGLRAAIECQLLGAKVVVVEKRDRMSRNNVLHLWPFVIHDLRNLAAKKFYGKFCAGSIDHISIRQLQCILLKVCLLLGVEFHEGVGFEELLEPTVDENSEVLGWRARVSPAEHPVSRYEFDALVGADGKRNTLRGFRRKDFRGKLAIAITANFINTHTEQEASVQEISGVAYIFKQQFFKDLHRVTGIDLENIVYYKDETHYFVMTAKKQSLLEKGVLIHDHPETALLLSKENVDRDALERYALEAAQFSTESQLPNLNFALNHYGESDVTLFDFTSMYAAENASMVVERNGRRLLCCLVGDSLLEPFWPTGSGCARGFLSALDAAWAVRCWGQAPPPHPVHVIMERESIYRLLAQTTPENLNRDFGAYTLDPRTRYPNLNRFAVNPQRVAALYNSDDPLPLDATSSRKKRKAEGQLSEKALLGWVCREVGASESEGQCPFTWALSPQVLATVVRKYRPDLLSEDVPDLEVYAVMAKHYLMPMLGSNPKAVMRGEVSETRMRGYLRLIYKLFKGEVQHVHYNTEITPEVDRLDSKNHVEDRRSDSSRKNRKRKSRTPQEEGRSVSGGSRSGKGSHVARLAAELASGGRQAAPARSKPDDLLRAVGRIEPTDWNVRSIERKMEENRMGRPAPRQAEKVPKWDREKFVARQQRLAAAGGARGEEPEGELEKAVRHINQMRRDAGRPELGTDKVRKLASGFDKKPEDESSPPVVKSSDRPPWKAGVIKPPPVCVVCNTRVFLAESAAADGLNVHKSCFRCASCKMALRAGMFLVLGNRLTCIHHSQTTFKDNKARQPMEVEKSESIAEMRERISLEASGTAAAEMDEDEWAGRNLLPSETSRAGLSSDEESSSEEDYTEAGSGSLASDSEGRGAGAGPGEGTGTPEPPDDDDYDLYYDDDDDEDDDDDDDDDEDFSDESISTFGGEESSVLEAAREARRREFPAARAVSRPTSSSEVEWNSETESDTSDTLGTAVSTDSEFEDEEVALRQTPPSITVTPPTAPTAPRAPLVVKEIEPAARFAVARPPTTDYPLSRTRSAGGLATKRALELKRRYLLGDPSPTQVRRSDSATGLDSQIKTFTMNICQYQAMLSPAPAPAPAPPLTPTEPVPPQIVVEKLSRSGSLSDLSASLSTQGGAPVPTVTVHDDSGNLLLKSSPDEDEDEPPELGAPEKENLFANCEEFVNSEEDSPQTVHVSAINRQPLETIEVNNTTPVADDYVKERPVEKLKSILKPSSEDHIKYIDDHITDHIDVDMSDHSEERSYDRADDYIDRSERTGDGDGDADLLSDNMDDRTEDYVDEHSVGCFGDRAADTDHRDRRSDTDRIDDHLADQISDYIDDHTEESVAEYPRARALPTVTHDAVQVLASSPHPVYLVSKKKLFDEEPDKIDSMDEELGTKEGAKETRQCFNGELSKRLELNKAREEQIETVRRLVLERIGGGAARKSRRARQPPPVPAPPAVPPPPARPPPPLRLVPSFSDPELTRVRRRRGIMKTVTEFFSRVSSRKKSTSWPANLNGGVEEWGRCGRARSELHCAGAGTRRSGAESRAGEGRADAHTSPHTSPPALDGPRSASEPRPPRRANSHLVSLRYPPLSYKLKTDSGES